jgi:hypothetical protein
MSVKVVMGSGLPRKAARQGDAMSFRSSGYGRNESSYQQTPCVFGAFYASQRQDQRSIEFIPEGNLMNRR